MKKEKLNLPKKQLELIRNTDDLYEIICRNIGREIRTMEPKERFALVTMNKEDRITSLEYFTYNYVRYAHNPVIIFRKSLYILPKKAVLARIGFGRNIDITDEDIELFQKYKKTAKKLGISLIDYFVMSKKRLISFRKEGVVENGGKR